MARAGRQVRMTVRVLLALALLLLSFAHQPAFARRITPAVAAEYVLPDGSIGDICFGMDGVDNAAHSPVKDGSAPICDYCRLASAVLLPPPPDDGYLILRSPSVIAARPDFLLLFVAYPRSLPQSRAPPVFV